MFRLPADLPPSKNEEERKIIIQTASKQSSQLNNPCLKEQKLSYKCLSDNNYDKTVCEVVFANYNACKDFWARVQTERRVQGITPYLPRPEDRERVKAEFLEKWDPEKKLNRK